VNLDPYGGQQKKVVNYAGAGAVGPAKTGNIYRFDHPHGVKYGLKNYVWESTTSVFRGDRYGQFRDRLEQRRYSKFFHKGDDEIPQGELEAAVSCIFVDGDGRPLEDAADSSCQNISTFMTSSIPYKEGEPVRTPIFSPFVSINVVGSGRAGSLAPGLFGS